MLKTIISTFRLKTLVLGLQILLFQVTVYGLDLDKSFNYVKVVDSEDWGEKISTVHWRLSAQGRQYDRETDSSTILTTNLSGVLQYKFYPELKFYGRFDTVFQTGFAQSRYGDLSPSTGVFVYDAYFTIAPFKTNTFELEVGAINQSRTLRNNVLISRTSFPGVSQVFDFDLTDSLSLSLRAQQLVPYSQTQSVEFRERQKTPYFLTESVKMKLKKRLFNIGLSFGLYDYSELPIQVADQSRLYGNSVTGVNANSRFDYDFQGWFSNFDLDLSLFGGKYLIQFEGHLVENTQAPENFNRGQEFDLNLYRRTKDYQIGPKFSIFSLEPDVAPAFYNSSTFGNTNRDGWSAGVDVFIMKKSKTKISASYLRSKLLNRDLNPFQEDQDRVVVTFQTNFKQLGAW